LRSLRAGPWQATVPALTQAAQAGALADAGAAGQWVASLPADSPVRGALAEAGTLVELCNTLGLDATHTAAARQALLGNIVPQGVSGAQLQRAIDAASATLPLAAN